MDMNRSRVGECREKLQVSRKNAQKSHDMDGFMNSVIEALDAAICFDAAAIILETGADGSESVRRFYNCSELRPVYQYLKYGNALAAAGKLMPFRLRDLTGPDLSPEDGRDLLREHGFLDALRGFIFLNGFQIGTIDLYRYTENSFTLCDVRNFQEVDLELVRCFCLLNAYRHELGSKAGVAWQMRKAYRLTLRQKDVLQHRLEGRDRRYIMNRLNIKETTLQKHIRGLLEKTGAKEFSQLNVIADNPECWPKIPGEEDPEK